MFLSKERIGDDEERTMTTPSKEDKATLASLATSPHRSVVLFYKYFLSSAEQQRNNVSEQQEQPSSVVLDDAQLFRTHSAHYLPLFVAHQKELCNYLQMRGRILISAEGVNGTLSAANDDVMQRYIDAMKDFDLTRELGPPPSSSSRNDGDRINIATKYSDHSVGDLGSPSSSSEHADDSNDACMENTTKRSVDMRLFGNIDWKLSSVDDDIASKCLSPFPDLKITPCKETVSTGGTVAVDDIPEYGGRHLSPEEFHKALLGEDIADNGQKKNIVLIDVRNTFEHAIGHFVNPNTNISETDTAAVDGSTGAATIESTEDIASESQPTTTEATPAINPQMTNFTQFDTQFCTRNASSLKDKRVLMYCTGGIRCEKASAMLRKRGVDDVCQLSGGIHRYLEKFGDTGLFKGKNFTFDQRVAIDPKDCLVKNEGESSGAKSDNDTELPSKQNNVVGKCLECDVPYDIISGSRVCTVCRDLVLVCPTCRDRLRELHCSRHSEWKNCYFTFLEIFDEEELTEQMKELKILRDELIPPAEHKCMRKTLSRQIDKVQKRIKVISAGEAEVHKAAPRRCRTCMETEDICDGLCWGFWKQSGRNEADIDIKRKEREDAGAESGNKKKAKDEAIFISVGDIVQPGPDWNELRLGPKNSKNNATKSGRVVEIKSWGSCGQDDCIAVIWDGESDNGQVQPKVYRWGVVAKNGKKMFDVRKFSK